MAIKNKKVFIILLIAAALVLMQKFDFDLLTKNKLTGGQIKGISRREDNLRVIFFNVGQGDSHFISTPNGQNILIDGGNDNTVLEKLAAYMPQGDRTIDLMILTHPHSDHVTGLIEVIKRYKVKRILSTWVIHTTSEYLEWLNLIKEKNLIFDKAIAPKQYTFGTPDQAVILSVLYPDQDISGQRFDDLNGSSVVIMLNYKNKQFLFTGDMPVDVEKKIIANGANLQAQVLKIAHQGSITSSSEEFLEAVNPDFAIIPVGANNYGHPSLRVIRRFERAGIRVLRTDTEGDIEFTIDGNGNLKLED